MCNLKKREIYSYVKSYAAACEMSKITATWCTNAIDSVWALLYDIY